MSYRNGVRMLSAVVFATAFFMPAAAQSPSSPEVSNWPLVVTSWRAVYEVEADGRAAQTITSRYQVLHESALEQVKRGAVSFSTSIQSAEVLEAYTIKKDGRQIQVPPGNYQTQVNDGRKGASPLFSDRSSLSVVFPDLAVGDSVHFSYRLTEKEPMFPGQFSMAMNFSPYMPYQEAVLTVRAPVAMKLLDESHFMQASESVADGKRTREYRYSNPKPRRWDEEEDQGLWKIEEMPGVYVSTFATYEAIAKAYGDRATPKAQPTPRVRELAGQIVGAEAGARERTRLLYEWVSKNITYGGNCIGVGAVVPRDLDVVLDNRMGDCKDHATLLQALLSAADVRSEQVLVNSGSQYDLARTPVVSMVNHVMTYVPQLQLYMDATAKEIPFGYLPNDSYAKPVIHVGPANAVAVLPSLRGETNEQRLHMTLKLAPNGSATGTLRVKVTGLQAAAARAYMRNVTPDMERDFVKLTLGRAGFKGRGTLGKGETAGMVDQYEMSIQFEIDNYLKSGATGAFVLAPVISTPLPVMNFSDAEERTSARRSQACYGFHSFETYELELPAGLELVTVPADLRRSGSLVDYSALYQRTTTGLTVTREVHDKTPVSICTPEISAELLKQALPVGENLRTQVLYKRQR